MSWFCCFLGLWRFAFFQRHFNLVDRKHCILLCDLCACLQPLRKLMIAYFSASTISSYVFYSCFKFPGNVVWEDEGAATKVMDSMSKTYSAIKTLQKQGLVGQGPVNFPGSCFWWKDSVSNYNCYQQIRIESHILYIPIT